MDAFLLDWNQYQRICLMEEVFRKLEVFQGQAIIIAPKNTRYTFRAKLETICNRKPDHLTHPRLLSQGINNKTLHQNPRELNLHAWTLLNRP